MTKTEVKLEYIIHASPYTVFNCISTPSGLEEWFADRVNVKGEEYTFYWEGEERKAKLVSIKKDQSIKFHWLEDGKERTFFEIKITIDEMTSELALVITDFCESGEEEDVRLLWESALENLKKAVGG
jgi:uncharacterized protein YndB with AHSA1/START domain